MLDVTRLTSVSGWYFLEIAVTEAPMSRFSFTQPCSAGYDALDVRPLSVQRMSSASTCGFPRPLLSTKDGRKLSASLSSPCCPASPGASGSAFAATPLSPALWTPSPPGLHSFPRHATMQIWVVLPSAFFAQDGCARRW